MTLRPFTVICPRCSSPAPFTHGRYFCSGCWWCEWCGGTCNGTTATGCQGVEGEPGTRNMTPWEKEATEKFLDSFFDSGDGEPESPRGLEEIWKTEAKQFREDIRRLAGQRPPLLVGDAGKPASPTASPTPWQLVAFEELRGGFNQAHMAFAEHGNRTAVACMRAHHAAADMAVVMMGGESTPLADLESVMGKLEPQRNKAREAAPALHLAMEAGGLVKRGDHFPWHCPSCGEWETTHRVEPTWWESFYKGWEKVMECPRCSHRYPL
jgi:hypothetical protein